VVVIKGFLQITERFLILRAGDPLVSLPSI